MVCCRGDATGGVRVLSDCTGWVCGTGRVCGAAAPAGGVGRRPSCQRRRISSRRAKRRSRMAAMRMRRAAGSILPPGPGGAARSVAILAPWKGVFVNIIC